MRKYIVTFLSIALLIPVASCGSASTPVPQSTSTAQSTAQTSQTASATAAASAAATSGSAGGAATAASVPTGAETPIATSTSAASPVSTETTQGKANVLNIHALPLGDGKVSTGPKSGYVYSCQTNFKVGGAEHTGSWIHGNTWDLSQKIAVEGNVTWPGAQFNVLVNGNERDITGNGLPVGSETGIFPIQRSDPAYQIDTNPNSIQKQNVSFSLPSNPTKAAAPSCVPMGMIGIALNGVAIFNALDASGRDAVAHEVQDVCDGHPQAAGIYHYHGPSPCMPGETGNAQLVGYALDGFGIYSMYDANGKEITNADLDACHGTTSEVMWNGKLVNMYHYVLTQEYPYTIGCFVGTPIRVRADVIGLQSVASVSTGTPVADSPRTFSRM